MGHTFIGFRFRVVPAPILKSDVADLEDHTMHFVRSYKDKAQGSFHGLRGAIKGQAEKGVEKP
jgi:hypothetical protein